MRDAPLNSLNTQPDMRQPFDQVPRAGLNPGLAGLLVAVVAGLLMWAWDRVVTWYITGSAFTDLPGQNSLRLISGLSLLAGVVIVLTAGRLAGLLSRSSAWVAALIGVLPLNLLVLAGAHDSPVPYISALILAVCLLGLFAAYVPRWQRSLTRGLKWQGGRPTRA